MRIWHIRLFGTLRVNGRGNEVCRFSTRKTGTLLAFLAFYQEQRHTRDGLCEMLWPDEPPEKSRARLRVALTSLRHQLEPPGTVAGSIIRTEGNEQVQLAAEMVTTDVADVQQALKILGSAASLDEQLAAARRLTTLFTHPLLTGFYDNWIILERDLLSQTAVQQLILLARRLPLDAGQELAWHAARLDPLAEEPLLYLLPRLAGNGQQGKAQRTLQTFQRRWETTLGQPPSQEMRDLAALLSTRKKVARIPPSDPLPAAPAAMPLPDLAETGSVRPPVHLPLYLTRFFGRESERKALHGALGETRLVTLTGPGGAGKTRLAVEAAREWKGACWFVPLADVGHPERLLASVCDSLGDLVRSRTGPDSPDALLTRAANALADTPEPLLILDNLEQIADIAGSLLLVLLERVPTLCLLVTSRLRLHLPGERELPLDPLPIPPLGEPGQNNLETLTDVARIPSVALFLDRARAARPDYQITPRNRDDILAVCRMLEGIPLAIELVAARGGTQVPTQLRANLAASGNLRVADRRASANDRHRSLHAAIDWSYRHLPPDLRAVFDLLSVFRGGFGADAVGWVGGVDESAANEALARLRAHSLVGSIADAGQMRFSLLESLRTFADEQLTNDGRAVARQRHAEYFADFAERADAAIMGADQPVWLARLDSDLDNLRTAMESDLTANPSQAVRVAGAIWMYWHLRGRPTEGRFWLEQALAACPPSDTEVTANDGGDDAEPARFHRARALHGAGTLAWSQGEGGAARPLLEESLRLRRKIGDMTQVAATLNNLGLLARSREELDEARRYLSESLALRRQTGATPAALASSLNNLGVLDWERGNSVGARAAWEEALLLFRDGGDHVGEGHALNNLGNVALGLGDFPLAEKWYAESLAVKRGLGYPLGIALTLSNVGVAALYQDRWAVATVHLEESLRIYRELDAPDGIATQLRNLGQIATRQGEWSRAYTLLAESMAIQRKSDSPTHLAGNLEAFALFATEHGQAKSAACLLGAAAAQRLKDGAPLHPSEAVSVVRTADGARTLLGIKQFDTCYGQGASLTPDEAAKIALTLSP